MKCAALAVGPDPAAAAVAIPAATSLHNLVRSQWPSKLPPVGPGNITRHIINARFEPSFLVLIGIL